MTSITQILDDLPVVRELRDDPDKFVENADKLMTALPPMVTQFRGAIGQINIVIGEINIAAASVALSAQAVLASEANAAVQAQAAIAAAASAVTAPGTSSTSTTSLSLTAGVKNLTVLTGKTFPRGGSVKVASNADVSRWMVGSVDSYNAATGAMAILVDANDINGTGTFSDWTVSVSGHRGAPATMPATGITNIVRATSNYTLTAIPTALEITPIGYGCTVFLPNAIAITPIDPLHTIINQSYFDVRVCDLNGVLLGFVPAKTKSTVALISASAAGVWGISNLSKTGIGIKSTAIKLGFFIKVTKIDNDREFILYADRDASYLYGLVYNRTTNVFGTPVLIRATPIQLASFASCVKAGIDKILVVSCNMSTAFEAVVLTFNNVTITVNTAASATLSASLSKFATDCELVAVGPGFATLYELAGPSNQIRALSISGTTVTIGAAVTLSGELAGCMQIVSGTTVITFCRSTPLFYASPYTLSGVTLAIGYEYADTNGAFTKVASLPNGRYFVIRGAAATLLTHSGTAVTGSHVASVTTGGGIIRDAAVVGNNKILVVEDSASDNCNLVSDVLGTATKGTPISATASSNYRNIIYVDGDKAYLNQASNTDSIVVLDCSGASPVITSTLSKTGASNRGMIPATPSDSYANAFLQKSKYLLYSDKFASTFGMHGDAAIPGEDTHQLANGVIVQKPPLTPFTIIYSVLRGIADNERWASESYNSYIANSTIIKLECAA